MVQAMAPHRRTELGASFPVGGEEDLSG
eukprot:SAG22_NODE_6094_length_899_cov_2.952500_1_plen_27_part_10